MLLASRFSAEKYTHATNSIHKLGHWHHDLGFGRDTSVCACNGSSDCTGIAGEPCDFGAGCNPFQSRQRYTVSHRSGDGFFGEKR